MKVIINDVIGVKQSDERNWTEVLFNDTSDIENVGTPNCVYVHKDCCVYIQSNNTAVVES